MKRSMQLAVAVALLAVGGHAAAQGVRPQTSPKFSDEAPKERAAIKGNPATKQSPAIKWNSATKQSPATKVNPAIKQSAASKVNPPTKGPAAISGEAAR